MPPRRILLIRHGETDYNVNGRWQGQLDTPLNATGRVQAKQVAQALSQLSLDAVVSSDLSRAYDTAKEIAKLHGQEVQTDVRWREVHLGVFQGLTRQEIATTYPLEYNGWHHDDHFVVPRGESRMILQARAYSAWQDLLQHSTAQTLAVVSHGGTIRLLLARLFSSDFTRGRHLGNTSITELERHSEDSDQWTPLRVGDISHLEQSRPNDGY